MAAPTVSDYAMQLLKPNGLTQTVNNPLDFLSTLMSAQSSQTPSRPRLDTLDVALTGRMRSDVGVNEVASKNMSQGASAMKTTLEPLTRVQTLLGEMANLTAQAGEAYNGNKMDDYEAYQTQYAAKAQEVSNLVKGTSFNGISLMDGAGWKSPNSSVRANYKEVTDSVTGEVSKVYAGTGTIGIQGGRSTMNVEMIDFGSSAKENGHSLVDLVEDTPWLAETNVSMPEGTRPPDTDPIGQATYDEQMTNYRDSVRKYFEQEGMALDEDEIQSYTAEVTIKTGNFDAATSKLFELQDLVGMAIARYGAFNASMERQSAMHKGQADILKQAVSNQLSGSSDLETMTIDLLRSSIINGRG